MTTRAYRRCTVCSKVIRPSTDRTACVTCVEPTAAPQATALFYDHEPSHNIGIYSRREGTKVVSLSDTQYPFVDEPLVAAVERFMSDWQPDDILYNGDISDMYEISDFDKNPSRQFNLMDELTMTRAFLERHAVICPDAERYFIFGNHEDRLRRYIWKHAGAVADLVRPLEEALGLDEQGIKYVTYGKHVEYLGFVFTHGNFVSSGSGMTARKHLAAYGSSGAHGHTHRLGSISKTDMNGRTHTFMEQGCLCRVDLEYNRGVADWQQGFLIGTVHGGALHPQLIHVIEAHGQRGFVADGRYYKVED